MGRAMAAGLARVPSEGCFPSKKRGVMGQSPPHSEREEGRTKDRPASRTARLEILPSPRECTSLLSLGSEEVASPLPLAEGSSAARRLLGSAHPKLLERNPAHQKATLQQKEGADHSLQLLQGSLGASARQQAGTSRAKGPSGSGGKQKHQLDVFCFYKDKALQLGKQT